MKYLLLLLMLSSCGVLNDTLNEDMVVEHIPFDEVDDPRLFTSGVNENVSPYIDQYINRLILLTPVSIDINHIPVNIINFLEYPEYKKKLEQDNVRAICIVYSNEYTQQTFKEILIDASFWSNANESTRELVVTHELGHCHLDLRHTDENLIYVSPGVPKIMNPSPDTSVFVGDAVIREAIYDMLIDANIELYPWESLDE
jgi:hypothetical protein